MLNKTRQTLDLIGPLRDAANYALLSFHCDSEVSTKFWEEKMLARFADAAKILGYTNAASKPEARAEAAGAGSGAPVSPLPMDAAS